MSTQPPPTTKGFHYRIDVSDVDRAIEVVRAVDGVMVEPGTLKGSITVSAETDIARQNEFRVEVETLPVWTAGFSLAAGLFFRRKQEAR